MNKVRQNIVLGIIGILLIVISLGVFWYKESLESISWIWEFIFLSIFDIAFLLVGVCITNVVWQLVGGEPTEVHYENLIKSFKLVSNGFEAGLMDINPRSSSFASSNEWLEIIAKAKHEICIQGYTLLIWTNSAGFKNTLIDLAQRGVQIRLVFMDENAKYINAGINDQIDELSLQRVQSDISLMTSFIDATIKDLNKISNVKGSISYRKTKNALISSQLVIVDNQIYYTPYITSVNTPDSPIFVIKNQSSQLYLKFKKEFECIWDFDIEYEKKIKEISTYSVI